MRSKLFISFIVLLFLVLVIPACFLPMSKTDWEAKKQQTETDGEDNTSDTPEKIGSWTTTTSFTVNRYEHTSVIYNNYLYTIGGVNGIIYADVQYAKLNTDGTIQGLWQTTTSLPTARYDHCSLAYNGYMYTLGGHDNTTRFNDVLYAPINNDGTIGNWQSTTAFANPRFDFIALVYNGYLYVAGGDDGANCSNVQYAQLQSDGTIPAGGWTTANSLPYRARSTAGTIYNGYIYVVDGDDGDNPKYIQWAKIDPNSGSLASWNTINSLPERTWGHTCLAYNGTIFVIGGFTPGSSVRNTLYYATINGDGSLNSWDTTSLPFYRALHSSVMYGNYLYVIGGLSGSNQCFNTVSFVPVN